MQPLVSGWLHYTLFLSIMAEAAIYRFPIYEQYDTIPEVSA